MHGRCKRPVIPAVGARRGQSKFNSIPANTEIRNQFPLPQQHVHLTDMVTGQFDPQGPGRSPWTLESKVGSLKVRETESARLHVSYNESSVSQRAGNPVNAFWHELCRCANRIGWHQHSFGPSLDTSVPVSQL